MLLRALPAVPLNENIFTGDGHSLKYGEVCPSDLPLIDTGGKHRSHRQKPQGASGHNSPIITPRAIQSWDGLLWKCLAGRQSVGLLERSLV